MSAKEFFISLFTLALIAFPSAAAARGGNRGGDYRENLQYEGWARLIPTHIKLQYAGGMGLLSAGVGWDYGKRAEWETDLLWGFLPACYADEARMTFTLRQNYIPWSVRIGRRVDLEPLTCAMYINKISGDEFWDREPGRYPHGENGYYCFSSRTRVHLNVGQRLTLQTPNAGAIRSLSLYYEFGVNDLMLISKFNNSTLALSDIVHFSVGAKMHIFK